MDYLLNLIQRGTIVRLMLMTVNTSTGKFADTVADTLQVALGVMMRWSLKERLTIYPQKTVIVPFTQKQKLGIRHTPMIGGENVKLTKEVKCLGMTG